MKYFTRVGDHEREYTFERQGGRLRASCGDQVHELDLSMIGDGTAFSLIVDGDSHDLIVERADRCMIVQVQGERIAVEVVDERERAAQSVAGARGSGVQEICAVMPGVVADVRVTVGDAVEVGQTVVVLEAMKMQNPLQAEAAGVVAAVLVAPGEAVAGGALLVRIEP